jgi:hypothetical protein
LIDSLTFAYRGGGRDHARRVAAGQCAEHSCEREMRQRELVASTWSRELSLGTPRLSLRAYPREFDRSTTWQISGEAESDCERN